MQSRDDLGVYGDGRVPDDPPRRGFGGAGQSIDSGSDQVSCTDNYRSTPQYAASFRNVLSHGCRTEIVCAEAATFDDLTPLQAYGLACVVCGETFADLDSVPVGISVLGGTVFACAGCAAKPVEAGGLGIDPADGWQGGRA